jgi:hypothetical protein
MNIPAPVLCFLVALLSTVVVAAANLFMVKKYLKRPFDSIKEPIQHESNQDVKRLTLQACERLTLMLERITPSQAVLRESNQGMTAGQLQQQLLRSVREEYNHNISQQLYVSEDTWNKVAAAREAINRIINEEAAKMEAKAPAADYAAGLFAAFSQMNPDYMAAARKALKNEIRNLS